jgi:uncharacterized protein with HEPN domain
MSSPKRRYDLFLKDIFQATEKILKYIDKKSYAEFIQDEVIIDAVIRNLEVIGEAVKHLPEPLKKRYSTIEWNKIAGMRDILIHEYFGIDYDILWDIVTNNIPKLNKQIKPIIQDLESKHSEKE